MGTRGIFGVRINGKDKITYNHFDSDPNWLGKCVVSDIRDVILPELDKYKQLAEAVELVSQSKHATKAEIEKYNITTKPDLGVSEQSEDDWYCILRELQGCIAGSLQAGVMIDSHKFVKDSLFCEYGYMINFDENTFEVYEGFQKKKIKNGGRYHTKNSKSDEGYYPIALVTTFPLNDIPEDWIKQAFPKEEE